jgi:nitrogen-specific signal transduction histidine kinase
VGVQMREDEDAVTGHHLVEVAVWDDAPGALTNAMIRGRYIGRGLGLAVDLVNRHGGAIRAEPREGEIKAVVVQFPAVEAAAVEAEWTA